MKMQRLFIALSFIYFLTAPAGATGLLLNVKDYGAKGDGVTDDYNALIAAAQAICAAPAGSKLVYPAGTYWIGRYRIIGGPQQNTVQNIEYTGCHNVTISGTGAVISVKGDFNRSHDYDIGIYEYSWRIGVIPFSFINSSSFTLQGFELNGNVDKMTRDAGVIESQNAGVLTANCSNYLLQNLNVHHFLTDGFLIGASSNFADKDVHIENVNSHNNSRQGISLIQVRRAWILNSIFQDTGRVGAYGATAPAGGIDIEPDETQALYPGLDMNTGEIYIFGSQFTGNLGPQVTSQGTDAVDSVYASGLTVKGSADAYSSIFSVGTKVMIVENSGFNAPVGSHVSLFEGNNANVLQAAVWRANTFILGSLSGLQSIAWLSTALPIDFFNNTVNVSAGTPDSTAISFKSMRSVGNNQFVVDGSQHAAPAAQTAIWYDQTVLAWQNQYKTNLAVPGAFFCNGYTSNAAAENFPNAPAYVPSVNDQNWSSGFPYTSGTGIPPTDTSVPVISSIYSSSFGADELITWLTDTAGDSTVEYGLSTAYGSQITNNLALQVHGFLLTGLQPGTVYHYRVKSVKYFDLTPLSAVSQDYVFTTPTAESFGPSPAISAVSVSPSSGYGLSQTFIVVSSDTYGASDIVNTWFLLAGDFNNTNTYSHCMVLFAQSGTTRGIQLINNAPTGSGTWQAPMTMGVAGTESNQSCQLDAGASSVSLSGNTLTLNLAVNFSTSDMTGVYGSYIYSNNAAQNSGWQKRGTWSLTAPIGSTPTPVALPTPVLNLPAYVAVNGTLSLGYPAGYSNLEFEWTITPVTNSPSPEFRAPVIAGAGSVNFRTTAGQANLASSNLTLGVYTVTVRAVDANGNTSPTAQQQITLVPSDLAGVVVSPNPWRSNLHTGHPMTFSNLTVGTTIKIFTIAGQWVKTLPAGGATTTWDLTNDSGDKVASGLYLYLITSSQGQKKTGQLAIIK